MLPSGKIIASGSRDGTVRLWNLQGDLLGEPLQAHEPYVKTVAFSPDGKLLPSGGSDNTIKIWYNSLSQENRVNYTQLQKLLKQRKWKEADQETESLIRSTIGQESLLEKIRLDLLREISCVHWREIDKLWSEYSNAHFGLGMQVSVWQNRDDNSETYHKDFGEQVGWGQLVNGSMRWRNVDALDFSLEAPPGHLPRRWYKNCDGRLRDIFSFLGQRFVQCSIELPLPTSKFRLN